MSTTITTSQSAMSSPLKRLITRHPLLAFFIIAFAGAWIAFLPLVLAQNGLGLFPYTIPEIGPYPPSYLFAVLGALLGPTLASFMVTAITTGKAGVQQLLRRYVIWRVGLRWYLLVLVGVPLFQLVCSSVFLGIAPLTALILGPLWALWHLPVFFVPGQIFEQKVGAITMVVQMVLMIIVAIPTRIIMNWVFNNTKGSILIAILLHAALDASNSGSDFIKQLLTTSQLEGYGLGSALVFPLIAAVLLLIFTKGRLSYRPDRVVQPLAVPQPVGAPLTEV